MRKKMISKKQEFSLKDIPIKKVDDRDLLELNSKDFFQNKNNTAIALLECLLENDTDSFMEIIDSYLRVNKMNVAKKSNLSRSTVQQAFAKNGNPTLKTIAKIVYESSIDK